MFGTVCKRPGANVPFFKLEFELFDDDDDDVEDVDEDEACAAAAAVAAATTAAFSNSI